MTFGHTPNTGPFLELNNEIALEIVAPSPKDGHAYSVTYEPGHIPARVAKYGDFSGGLGASEQHVDGMYSYGLSVCTWVPGVAFPAGAVTEVMAVVTSGSWSGGITANSASASDVYLFGGRHVYKIPNGSGNPTLLFDAGANAQLRNPCAFGDYIFCGVDSTSSGDAYSMLRLNTTTGIVTTHLSYAEDPGIIDVTLTVADHGRSYLAKVYWDTGGAGAYRLVGTNDIYNFKTCTADPTIAGNWTAAVTVGDTHAAIKSLVAGNRYVAICKSDGIYSVDALGYTPLRTPGVGQFFDYENGICSAIYDGEIFANYGYDQVRVSTSEDRDDLLTQSQPGAGQSFTGPIYGKTYPLLEFGGKLWTSTYNPITNTSYICRAEKTSATTMRYHGSVCEVTGRVRFAHVAGPDSSPSAPADTTPIMWLMADDMGGDPEMLYKFELYKGTSWLHDYQAGEDVNFATNWSLFLADPYDPESGLKRVPQRFEAITTNAKSTNKINVKISADSGPYTSQGYITESPRQAILSGLGGFTNAYRIDSQLEAQNSESLPLILRGYRIPTSFQDEQYEIRTYMVLLAAAGSQPAPAGREIMDPNYKWSKLLSYQGRDAVPITIRDEQGLSWVVEIYQGLEKHVARNRDGGYDMLAKVVMRLQYQTNIHWDSDGLAWDQTAIFWVGV